IEPRPSAPRTPASHAAAGDDGRVTDVLETALRDLIADAAAHHREREQPSRKMFAIGALLVLGAGIGAILVQWSSPPARDQAVATSTSVIAAPARAAVAPSEVKPAQAAQTASVTAPAAPATAAASDRAAASSAASKPAGTADVATTTPAPAAK